MIYFVFADAQQECIVTHVMSSSGITLRLSSCEAAAPEVEQSAPRQAARLVNADFSIKSENSTEYVASIPPVMLMTSGSMIF